MQRSISSGVSSLTLVRRSCSPRWLAQIEAWGEKAGRLGQATTVLIVHRPAGLSPLDAALRQLAQSAPPFCLWSGFWALSRPRPDADAYNGSLLCNGSDNCRKWSHSHDISNEKWLTEPVSRLSNPPIERPRISRRDIDLSWLESERANLGNDDKKRQR